MVVNVRKIVSRARRHLTAEQRESVDVAEHRRLLKAFVAAEESGDIASLEGVMRVFDPRKIDAFLNSPSWYETALGA